MTMKDLKRDDFTGYFDNVRLFLKPSTMSDGSREIEIKFVCEDCKTLINREDFGNRYALSLTPDGIIEYHKAKFWCSKCWKKRLTLTSGEES